MLGRPTALCTGELERRAPVRDPALMLLLRRQNTFLLNPEVAQEVPNPIFLKVNINEKKKIILDNCQPLFVVMKSN